MATTTTHNTMLDDIKDLVWLTKDRIDSTYEELSAQEIYFDDDSDGWALAEIQRAALETLAKHIPGMTVDNHGLAVYSDDAAHASAHSYDDGTPMLEYITFDDVPGMRWIYRPRHDLPRAEFMARARAHADQHKADLHARYTNVGGLGIEFTGAKNEPFSAHILTDGGNDAASVHLTREEVFELRDGLSRILATQAKEDECSPQSE